MAKPGALIAVLAGGRGSRLGGDKPAATLGGRPLVAHVLDAALATGLPTLVVAKRGTPLPALDASVVFEPDEPRHPLAGVIAAIGEMPAAAGVPDAVLAVGCDTPFLTPPLLRALASAAGACALEAGGRLQPLPARYPRAALAHLERRLAERAPMRAALAELNPQVLTGEQLAAFGDPERLCFNVNDAEDLREAERLLSGPAERPAPPPPPARPG